MTTKQIIQIISVAGLLLIIWVALPYVLNSEYLIGEQKKNIITQVVKLNNHVECYKPMSYELAEISIDYLGLKEADSLVEVRRQIEKEKQKRIEDSLRILFKKPYMLVTKYKTETRVDFGTFKEIETIKCSVYQEMLLKAKRIDSIEAKRELDAKQTAKELEILNKPCNTQQ